MSKLNVNPNSNEKNGKNTYWSSESSDGIDFSIPAHTRQVWSLSNTFWIKDFFIWSLHKSKFPSQGKMINEQQMSLAKMYL